MSSIDKILDRLKNKPNDFTISELTRILRYLGFKMVKSGKTSGSRIKYYHQHTNILISLHNPHNPKTLRKYQIDLVLEKLTEGKLI